MIEALFRSFIKSIIWMILQCNTSKESFIWCSSISKLVWPSPWPADCGPLHWLDVRGQAMCVAQWAKRLRLRSEGCRFESPQKVAAFFVACCIASPCMMDCLLDALGDFRSHDTEPLVWSQLQGEISLQMSWFLCSLVRNLNCESRKRTVLLPFTWSTSVSSE